MKAEQIEDLTKVANTLRAGCNMMADLPTQIHDMASLPEPERSKQVREFQDWLEQFLPGLYATADLCDQLAAGRSTRN